MPVRRGIPFAVISLLLAMLLDCPPVLGQFGIPSVPGRGGMGRGSQRRQQPQQQQEQFREQIRNMPKLDTTGTVEAVAPGYIRILSGANQSLVLQVLPDARCQLTAKAKPDFLCPGLYVRFSAEMNKKGTVEQKLTHLLVFTPSPSRPLGLEPDLGMGTSFGDRPGVAKKEEGKRPGFGAGAKKAAAPGTRDEKKAPAPAGKAAGSVGETYEIRGQITSVGKGRLTVNVGDNAYLKRPLVRAELADDVDIDVELDDLEGYILARKGDKVAVEGRIPPGASQGFAEAIDIIATEPLGTVPEAKKAASKGARSKRGPAADVSGPTEPGEAKADKKDAEKDAGTAEAKLEGKKAKTPKLESHKGRQPPSKKPAKAPQSEPPGEESAPESAEKGKD